MKKTISTDTRIAKDLCLWAVKTLEDKIESIGIQEENYSALRNIQKSVEALMETLQPEEETKERVKGQALRKGQFETLQPGE
jgi:hypothetical protein